MIAGIPPINWQTLEIKERISQADVFENLMSKLLPQCNNTPYGRWAYRLLPSIGK